MAIFTDADYRREAEKNLDKEKAKEKRKKPHWEVKHRIPTQMRSNLKWCPRLCQQKDSGSKGRKTYDGRKCMACGYIRGDNKKKNKMFRTPT